MCNYTMTREYRTSSTCYAARMIRRLKTGVILLFFINITLMLAQSYSSLKMEQLGNEIPAGCLPKADSIFGCPGLVKKKSLVVNYNDAREISHLGISMFSNETKELINLPVCNFIERIMLELVLERSNENLKQRLSRSKLSLQKNGVDFGQLSFTSLTNVLDEIQNPARFNLQKEPDKFTAIWRYNREDQFVFTFPASRDLIFGTDKKESDELLNKMLFGNGLLCTEKNDMPSETIIDADVTFNKDKNIYTKKGNEFQMSVINSNTYYAKTEGAYELLFTKDYPEESFLNLIIKNPATQNHKLHVTHRMYGNFSPDFDISLREFLCYFHDDFDFFAATSSSEANRLKLYVVLHNKDYNYIHLLTVTAPVENIFRQDGRLTAEFYSNIPQQSIRSLMGDLIKK